MTVDSPADESDTVVIKGSKQPFVAVIIDADQLLFHPTFLARGSPGAVEALDLIKRNINIDLEGENSKVQFNDIRNSLLLQF